MTFQIWVALHFLLKIGNRQSHWSNFHVFWTANHWTCKSHYHGVKYLAQKEGNNILVRVAKLLRLSIFIMDNSTLIVFICMGQFIVIQILKDNTSMFAIEVLLKIRCLYT